MTENEVVKNLMEETRSNSRDALGSAFTCGCCVEDDYVAEKIEPLLRKAFKAGVESTISQPMRGSEK